MNRNISQSPSFLSANPLLAAEWHPTQNGSLTLAEVTPGNEKKAWWLCANCHEWQAKIYSRNQGNGCPYCSGHRVSADTSLAAVNPALAAEWHPTRNGTLTPADVMPGTLRKAVIVREFGQTSDRIARTPVWGKE